MVLMRTLTYDQRHDFFRILTRFSDQVAVMRAMDREELAYGLRGTSFPPFDWQLISVELVLFRRGFRTAAEAAARVRRAWLDGTGGDEHDLEVLAPIVEDLCGMTLNDLREALHIPELPLAEE